MWRQQNQESLYHLKVAGQYFVFQLMGEEEAEILQNDAESINSAAGLGRHVRTPYYRIALEHHGRLHRTNKHSSRLRDILLTIHRASDRLAEQK